MEIFATYLKAFLVGGAICALGQLILNGWLAAGLEKTDASTATHAADEEHPDGY